MPLSTFEEWTLCEVVFCRFNRLKKLVSGKSVFFEGQKVRKSVFFACLFRGKSVFLWC